MAKRKKLAKGEKREPPPKDHPALMPKLAWKKLIDHLMAEHDIKHQYLFAEKLDVHSQTISRWVGKEPPLPDYVSFEIVARFHGISNEELAALWLSFMTKSAAGYLPGPAADSEVKEARAAYDEPGLLEQAKGIDRYDLNAVPMEQRPPLHSLGREIHELVVELEEAKRRLVSRLRLLIRCFRQLYQSAVDTARRMPSPTD